MHTETTPKGLMIREVDPQGEDAQFLLREAAVEARQLYSDLFQPEDQWPTNPPTPARGVYLIGYVGSEPLACGALRPLDDEVVELRRMFVRQHARRRGFGRALLQASEAAAERFGYWFMRLETGNRQEAAMKLYASYGFVRIEPFGEYTDDPTSVCYEKHVENVEKGA